MWFFDLVNIYKVPKLVIISPKEFDYKQKDLDFIKIDLCRELNWRIPDNIPKVIKDAYLLEIRNKSNDEIRNKDNNDFTISKKRIFMPELIKRCELLNNSEYDNNSHVFFNRLNEIINDIADYKEDYFMRKAIKNAVLLNIELVARLKVYTNNARRSDITIKIKNYLDKKIKIMDEKS